MGMVILNERSTEDIGRRLPRCLREGAVETELDRDFLDSSDVRAEILDFLGLLGNLIALSS